MLEIKISWNLRLECLGWRLFWEVWRMASDLESIQTMPTSALLENGEVGYLSGSPHVSFEIPARVVVVIKIYYVPDGTWLK